MNELQLSKISCERLESLEFGKNGGILFKLQKYPDLVVLMDDELISRIKHTLNASFRSQSIKE